MRTRVSGLIAVLVVAAGGGVARADDKCEIVAEITVEAVKLGATRTCLTGSPIACAVAAALDTAAGDGLTKFGLTEGCSWTVQKMAGVMKINLTAGEKDVKATKRAVQELKEASKKKFQVK